MVIEDIFVVLDKCLYTIKYSGVGRDELHRIFDQWNDPEYLNDFFNEHIADLQSGFYGAITAQQAVERTWREAQELENQLYVLAKKGQSGHHENLSNLFKPHTDSELEKALEKDKAYGTRHRSWLRIYAIRIDTNIFVICGGAIKLTKTMNEREHLLNELSKLEITRNFLDGDNEWADYFYELTL